MTLTDGLLLTLVFLAATLLVVGRRRAAIGASASAAVIGGLLVVLGRWQAAPAVAGAMALLATSSFGLARRRWRATASAVGVLLGIATAAGMWTLPARDLPRPSGPLHVGTTAFELSDPTSPMNPFAPGVERRRITVRAWYPADVSGGARTRAYFEDGEASLFGAGFGRIMGLPDFFWDHLKLVRTHGHVDAPVDGQGGPYPVVVFNHGYWSYPTQNTTLMEQLASHGYVVFSLSHPYDSAGVRFADGTSIGIPSDRVSAVIEEEMNAPSLERYFTSTAPDERYRHLTRAREESSERGMHASILPWLRDTQLLFDLLEDRGRIDGGRVSALVSSVVAASAPERIAVTGMSWGGAMAGTICLVDRRCKAAINLDGMAWDWRLIDTDLPVPLLLVQSDVRRMFPEQAELRRGRADFMFEKLASSGDRRDVVRVMIDETTHADMTDLTLFAKEPVRGRRLRLGPAAGEEVAGAVTSLVLAFVETHLKHRDVGFPEATLREHPRVRRHDVSYVKAWRRSVDAGSAEP